MLSERQNRRGADPLGESWKGREHCTALPRALIGTGCQWGNVAFGLFGHTSRVSPHPERGQPMAAKVETSDRANARRRQELRRSNAATPIPDGRRKRTRSWGKQQIRKDWR